MNQQKDALGRGCVRRKGAAKTAPLSSAFVGTTYRKAALNRLVDAQKEHSDERGH